MTLRKNKYVLTGSTWSAVFSLSTYLSRPKLWRLINGLEEENNFPHPAKQYGKDMEPISRGVFINVYQKYFSHWDFITQDFIERGSKALSWDTRFGCSPDGLIKNMVGGLEEGYELKNPFSKDIPTKLEKEHLGHVMQCILSMEAFNVRVWNLFYYRHETKESSWFRIHRNERFFKEVLYQEAVRFINSPDEPKRVPHNFTDKWSNAIFDNFKIDKIEL